MLGCPSTDWQNKHSWCHLSFSFYTYIPIMYICFIICKFCKSKLLKIVLCFIFLRKRFLIKMFEEWRLETQEKVSFRKHNSKRGRKLNKKNEITLSIKDHHEEEGPFHKTSKMMKKSQYCVIISLQYLYWNFQRISKMHQLGALF